MRRTIIIAATLILCGLPALAQAQPYDDRYADLPDDAQVRSVDVYTGDLNLRDPRDVREAARRIRHASTYVCRPRPDLHDAADTHDYRGCRYEAYDGAMDELSERADLQHRGRVYTREFPSSGR